MSMDRGDFHENRHHDPDDVECKYCGAPGLFWVNTGVRWRLADDHGIHCCEPSADDFDVLD